MSALPAIVAVGAHDSPGGVGVVLKLVAHGLGDGVHVVRQRLQPAPHPLLTGLCRCHPGQVQNSGTSGIRQFIAINAFT